MCFGLYKAIFRGLVERYNIINHIVALYHFTMKIDELFKEFFIYCGCYIYFQYIVSNCNLYRKKLD
jgi:hypothetical protein